MTDAFYTPPAVAAAIADAISGETQIRSAVDFAVGRGVLLDAILRCSPEAKCFGTDINPQTVAALKRLRPDWRLGTCDFLNSRSRNACAVLRTRPVFDVIVLNPPFSHRGASRRTVPLGTSRMSGSPATAFVALATQYCHPESKIAALIPTTSLHSEKDAQLWSHLKATWEVRVKEHFSPGWAEGTRAAVTLVVMSRHRVPAPEQAREHETSPVKFEATAPVHQVEIVRGTVPMYQVDPVASDAKVRQRLIHTTGLTRNGVSMLEVNTRQGREVSGPAVLLPRVGCPRRWKVQIYTDTRPAILSDCVIALKCTSLSEALKVRNLLLKAWPTFEANWIGSCAPYVTLARLRIALSKLGIGCDPFTPRAESDPILSPLDLTERISSKSSSPSAEPVLT